MIRSTTQKYPAARERKETSAHLWSRDARQTKCIRTTGIARPRSFIKLKFIFARLTKHLQTKLLAIQGFTVMSIYSLQVFV